MATRRKTEPKPVEDLQKNSFIQDLIPFLTMMTIMLIKPPPYYKLYLIRFVKNYLLKIIKTSKFTTNVMLHKHGITKRMIKESGETTTLLESNDGCLQDSIPLLV